MKKALCLIIVVLLLFSGCASRTSHEEYLEDKIDDLESEIEDLESENAELRSQLSGVAGVSAVATASKQPSAAAPAESFAEPTPTPLGYQIGRLGQEITVNRICTFTFKSAEYTLRVDPPDPGYAYASFICDDDGMIYYDLIITVKNESTSKLAARDFLTVIVLYDNTYEYSSFSVCEDDAGHDFHASSQIVNPLQTVKLHFIAEVPIGIADDNKPVAVIVECSGNYFVFSMK